MIHQSLEPRVYRDLMMIRFLDIMKLNYVTQL